MTDMHICICGYYYRPEFFEVIKDVHFKYPVHVVANKTWGDNDVPKNIPVSERDNLGLEWGAYDFYLHHVWDKKSPVLFLHDDIRFKWVIRNYEIMDPIHIFNTINNIDQDQVYFFESLDFAERNYFIHGRAFKCSARFLKRLLDDNNGFLYDENNDGFIRGPRPVHCKHFNWADYRFAEYIKKLNRKVNWEIGGYIIAPALECATRGRFDNEVDGPMNEE